MFRILYHLLKRLAYALLPETVANRLGEKVSGLIALKYWRTLQKTALGPPRQGLSTAGANIIGYVSAERSMGESCRLLMNGFREADIPHSLIDVIPGSFEARGPAGAPQTEIYLKYDINIFNINPPEIPYILNTLRRSIWDGRYNIAFWLWELEEFPKQWHPVFKLFNEIWTPSEFVSASIRKSAGLPVFTIPYGIAPPYDNAYDRDYFKLPKDKFLFLTAADGLSIVERKNPLGAVRAYTKAFAPDDDRVGLVVKTINTAESVMEEMRALLHGYPNIYFFTKTMDKTQVNSLIRCVDAFVSLHRAEGFGLMLAEAMYLGTATIATNWSANTEFMNRDVACLVDYKLVQIGRNLGPYHKKQRWAEPDLDQAAAYMKRLVNDQDFSRELAAHAAGYIQDYAKSRIMSIKIKNRMAALKGGARLGTHQPDRG